MCNVDKVKYVHSPFLYLSGSKRICFVFTLTVLFYCMTDRNLSLLSVIFSSIKKNTVFSHIKFGGMQWLNPYLRNTEREENGLKKDDDSQHRCCREIWTLGLPKNYCFLRCCPLYGHVCYCGGAAAAGETRIVDFQTKIPNQHNNMVWLVRSFCFTLLIFISIRFHAKINHYTILLLILFVEIRFTSLNRPFFMMRCWRSKRKIIFFNHGNLSFLY